MKLNFHTSPLYFYVYISESDSIKLVPSFEDYDETSVNFNVNCFKKEKKYINELKSVEKKMKIKDKKTFIHDYFLAFI